MSFYLLKSTFRRKETGDVILDISQIEAVVASKIIDKEIIFYQLRINMKSEDNWLANFNEENEVKTELRLLGFQEDMVSEFMLQETNIEEERKEKMNKMLKSMMS